MISYGAVVFCGMGCRVLSIVQIFKHVPGWFVPCWIMCEAVAMNLELHASGRFFPVNMHGDRGALHTIKAVLWNTVLNYGGVMCTPAVQMRHGFMLGGLRFLLWSAVWIPVRRLSVSRHVSETISHLHTLSLIL